MTYAAEVLADAPLAYYRLGESSGTVAVDSSGNGRDGAYLGSPALGAAGALAGDTNTAVTLNGTGQFVETTYGAWMNVGPFTVEAWIKTTDTAGAVWDRCNGSQSYNGWQYHIVGGKIALIPTANGGGQGASGTSTTTVSNGAWHHVAATWDNINIRIYVDGVLESTTANTNTTRTSTDGIRVGMSRAGSSGGGATSALGGVVDEAAYYGTVLSGTRIAAHYAAGIAAAPARNGDLAATLPAVTAAVTGTYVALPAYAAQVLASAPLAYYRLNEALGAVVISATTASSNWATEPPGNATDGNPATVWTTNATPTGWLRVQLSTAYATTGYSLLRRDDIPDRNPKTWTFEGSNDGTTFTTLDTQTNVAWTVAGETKSFTFANTTAYLYYRLNITANSGNPTYLSVQELTLTGVTTGGAGGVPMRDASGNGRNGTYSSVGITLGVAGAFPTAGTAVGFDGTGRADVAYAAWMDAANITVEAWVKTTATRTVLVLDRDNTARVWQFRLTSTGRVEFVKIGGGIVTVTGNTAVNNGSWHHVAATYDGTNVVLYVDGVVDKTQAAAGGLGAAAAAALSIGVNGSGGANSFFDGSIDEAAYYGTALSAATIANHYATATATPGNPVGSVAATLPALTAALAGTYTAAVVPLRSGTLAATLPRLTASLTGAYIAPPVGVSVFPEVTWIVEWDPEVVAPPERLLRGVDKSYEYDVAQVNPEPTYVDGLPTLGDPPAVARKAAHRDRIVVDGKDVTYFRDRLTPTPAFMLTEPFGYGSATLTFPQISGVLESTRIGNTGQDLWWLRIGAEVRIDRVNRTTNAKVDTDYRGVIVAVNVDGATLTVEVGGALSGRALLRDRQPPLFRKVVDVGLLAHDAVKLSIGLPFEPRLGPTTDIRIPWYGGGTFLDWLTHLCAMAVTRDREHWTVMPIEDRPKAYEMRKKNTTRKDFTVYFDDARIVPSLKRDVSEEPNTYYGYGVDEDGLKIKGDRYPGIEQGRTPAYPMAGGAPFGIGTTNAQTLTGEGVSIMIWRLIGVASLSRRDTGDGYDQDVANAIERLQDEAGLDATGTMNPDTWDALYDLGVTGYSIRQARVFPMVQRRAVREWNYTGTGVKTRRNNSYDRTILQVDKTMQFGLVESEEQIKDWCRRDMDRNAGSQWVGTAAVNGMALIRGEHNPGDPITAADVMPFRELRPGMNGWAPRFDGGTLFHLVGINVNDGGRTGSLTLDTQYRDMLTVTEVIQRNRDARSDPGRAFMRQHNSKSTASQDSLVTSSTAFGKLTGKVQLTGGAWNVFAVPAGQAGTVAWLDLRLADAATPFVCAVFGKRIMPGLLATTVGNPFLTDADGESKWSDPVRRAVLDERLLLYAAGDAQQPCGYWPRRHTNDQGDATPHPVTGVWRDDASFGYHTYAEPVLYVAVYPEAASFVTRGRIMGMQLEEGS